jgi:hypothetical protein
MVMRLGTHLVALGADQGALELALEEVDNDTVVPLLVTLPTFFT